jgi:large subunit ribosomal protein L21
MYAIVEIAGQQFKVAKDQKVFVHRLAGEEGSSVTFDQVLLIGNDKDITLGAPAIDGAQVEAKILRHLKGDKVIVFKKKRRKGYQKSNGHRQQFSEIIIESILASGGKKSVAKETVAKKTETKKSTAKVKADKLTLIEGIGPKVQEILTAQGIETFEKLAATSVEQLKTILEEQGGVYLAMDPTTWPEQAALAAAGKMDELKAWQEDLKGGREE